MRDTTWERMSMMAVGAKLPTAYGTEESRDRIGAQPALKKGRERWMLGGGGVKRGGKRRSVRVEKASDAYCPPAHVSTCNLFSISKIASSSRWSVAPPPPFLLQSFLPPTTTCASMQMRSFESCSASF